MEFFPTREILLRIGSLEIRWYAVLIMTGALLTYFISSREVKKAGYHPDIMDDLFVGAMFFGILGARIWYVLFSDLNYYLADPIRIIQIWNGGLAIQGGVMAGLLFALFYCKKHNYQFMHLVDMILPNVLVAQAMGRWGNFANQECYGPVVDESYFNGILGFIKSGMFIDGHYRMPMFFIESCLCILGWILIQLYRRHGKKMRGNGFFGYLAWYGVIRFFIEHYRTDSLVVGGFKTAQLIGIGMAVIGLAGLAGAFKKLYASKKPVLIFDLDGTLLDTEKAIFASFDEVLHKHMPDLVLTERDYVSFLGPTLQESFKKYAPDFDTETLVAEYREANRKLHDTGIVQPIRHVPELLKWLKENGYQMAIASSKKAETCRLGLKVTGLEEYFDIIIGADDVVKHKPDKETIVKAYEALGTSMSNTIYVGDSPSDVVCARNAGVFSIALVSNELRRQELSDIKPNRLIDDMAEIESILQEDHPWTYNMM